MIMTRFLDLLSCRDNTIKEVRALSEESSCNTLIALLCVKPLAWLELTDGSPFRVLTVQEVNYASVS